MSTPYRKDPPMRPPVLTIGEYTSHEPRDIHGALVVEPSDECKALRKRVAELEAELAWAQEYCDGWHRVAAHFEGGKMSDNPSPWSDYRDEPAGGEGV